MTTRKPLTIKERRARYRAKGRNVSTVITDEKALEKLDALIDSRGGVKPAIEYALRHAPAKVLDEAVEVAVVAYWEDCANGPGYEDSYTADRGHMRAALLAGVKVLLEPLAAEWRATASDLYFPDDSDCCARGRIEVENGTLKDCADRLESIYAPSLGEGDGR